MHKIECSDVESRRHDDPGASVNKSLGELEANLPVVQAAVDVSRRDIDQ